VRTGEVSVEVPRDKVAAALRDLVRLAAAHRGFVAASSSSTDGDSPTGNVTLRVPVADFDAVVDEVGRYGRVLGSTSTGEDVGDEVADVAARLKTLVATRAQLQALLARAKDVGEVLAVQTRVTEVQTQIEQLQAKQASLADRTTYGTLRVDVLSPGARQAEPSGFRRAWRNAVDGFVGGFEALVAASGTLAFLLLVGGVLLLLARLAYRAFVRRMV
jgi:hypothetical protein